MDGYETRWLTVPCKPTQKRFEPVEELVEGHKLVRACIKP